MKILSIHNIFWSHYKNALFATVQKHADKQGIDWQFVHIARNELKRKSLEFAGSEYDLAYRYKVLFDDYLDNLSFIKITRGVLKEIRNQKPDVLNLTGFYPLYNLIWIAYGVFKGIKVVISNDSTASDQANNWIKNIIKKWAVGNADGFFCFGKNALEYMQQLGAKDFQILADKCGVVNNDLVYKLYGDKSENELKNKFMYIGRLSEEKNLPLLLAAFAKLKTNVWKLVMVGDGPLKEALLVQAKALNINDKIEWESSKPWYEIPSMLHKGDVLMLTSLSEAWGLVINEAMVCGKPVIISDKCGCVADLVPNGEEGIVFESDSVESLSTAMEQFMGNPAMVYTMGRAARQRIAQYTLDNAAAMMVSGVKRICR